MKTKMTMCVFALSALCSFYVCHSKAETKIWKQDYEAYGRKISINIPVDDMGMDKIEIIRAEPQKVNERKVEKTKWSDDADFCKDSGMIETLTEGEESWPVSYLLSEDTFITILYDRSPCELRKYGNGRQLWRDGVSYYPNEINPQDIYAENNNVSLKAAEDYLGKIIEYYYDSQDSDYEIDYVTVNDRARKNGKDVDTYQSGTYEIYFSQKINNIPILGRWTDLYDMFAQAENKDLQPEDDLEYSFKATYSGNVDLIAQNPKFVTFIYDSYVFSGGAHGMSFWQTKTISKSNGKLINGNILNNKVNTAEFKPLLKQGLNAYFTAQKGAVYQCDFQEADLQNEVFGEYNVNNLPLPQSKPFLTDNGVGFAYLPYEISWYANGRISFVLPYEIMKPYLTSEALDFVAGYSNKNVSAQAYVDEQTQADYQKYRAQAEHKKCAD